MAAKTQQPEKRVDTEWMPAPDGVDAGVPRGLEYLQSIDQLLIHQQVELFEAVSGIETKNKYAIKNTLGQQVYFAHEESDLCMRICCKNQRGFLMHVLNNFGQEVLRINRPFKCCAGCCWCANFDCCAWEVEVEAPPGNVIGRVRQNQSLLKPYYDIIDADGNTVLKIRGPWCVCQDICCQGDIDFNVLSRDGDTQVGKISKQWGGIVRDWFTAADNFGVSFPHDLDVKAKALLMAAAFLIDYMYFERNS